MKYLSSVLIVLLMVSSSFAAQFVSPINFEPTDSNKAAVVAYIKQNVKEDCTKVGMNSESVLRMMEQKNLDAFKVLTRVEDTSLLVDVINKYCGIGMCNYATLLMMYKEELKAKGKTLKW